MPLNHVSLGPQPLSHPVVSSCPQQHLLPGLLLPSSQWVFEIYKSDLTIFHIKSSSSKMKQNRGNRMKAAQVTGEQGPTGMESARVQAVLGGLCLLSGLHPGSPGRLAQPLSLAHASQCLKPSFPLPSWTDKFSSIRTQLKTASSRKTTDSHPQNHIPLLLICFCDTHTSHAVMNYLL